MAVHVVGGFYKEHCTRPTWDETYGSGGRAAAAIATFGSEVVFHTYTSAASQDQLKLFASMYRLSTEATHVAETVSFSYLHDLANPEILPIPQQSAKPLHVKAEYVVRYGMLEGDAIVEAEWAVYDPQNQGAPIAFAENGSKATHLALVLNSREARQLAGLPSGLPLDCAETIASTHKAEVVIIKQGAQGAFVWTPTGTQQVPAYRTKTVWKIGSGDCFVAYFAQAWMVQKMAPSDAADYASRATAYYCETRGFATAKILAEAHHPPIGSLVPQSQKTLKRVYLAGPFFHLGQIWLIEQARTLLQNAGLEVFSPFHDVGLGSAQDVVKKDIDAIHGCDLMFAVADGLDPGTIFEIGYSRCLGKPVVIYSEVQVGKEGLKMMEGTDCEIYSSFATAIYATLWKAVEM